MNPTRGALKWGLPAVVGIAALVVSSLMLNWLLLDQQINDWVIRLRGPIKPHPDILLVTADRGSIDRLGDWPFSDEVQQSLLKNLKAAGAKCVVFVDPPWQAGKQPTALLGWARDNPDITVLFAAGVAVDPFAEEPVSVAQELEGPGTAAFTAGVAWLEPDADGVVRRLPLQLRSKDRSLPTLPVAVAEKLGADPLPQSVLSDGYLRPAFAGPARSYPSFAFWRVLDDDVPAEFLGGKICLVGGTDSLEVATRSTPTSRSPMFMPPVEIHANGLDAILSGRYYREPVLLVLLMGLVVAVILSLLFSVLKPAHAVAALAAYLALLVPASAWLAGAGPVLIPIVPLGLMGAITCLASLSLQLVSVQDDLLELLTASHEISWIFSEAEKTPDGSGEQIAAVVHLARQVLKADQLAILLPSSQGPSTPGQDTMEVRVASVAGRNEGDPQVLSDGGRLTVPATRRFTSMDGEDLAPDLTGNWWLARLDYANQPVGWLLVRLSTEADLPTTEQMVGSLSEHLAGYCADVLGRRRRKSRSLWELPILRVFSRGYVSRVLARLAKLEERNRSERQVLSRMLDDQEVGLVLADGLGRVRLVNRFFKDVATASGIQWGGGNAFKLLSMLTQKKVEDIAGPLGKAFAEDLPTTFPIKLETGLRQSFLVTATPLRTSPMATINPHAALQAWPDHFMILLADVTALQQVDAMKTELLESISYKARNHLAALIGYGDLITSEPEMAGELSGELTSEAQQLTDIFENFHSAAQFSLDHKEKREKVPINMNRMAREVIQNVSELAKQMQVEIRDETEQIVNLVRAEEQGLRTALVSILYTCLSSSRAGSKILIKVSELEDDLLVTIQGKGCILSPRMIRRLLVRTEGETEQDVASMPVSNVPQRVEREGIKWLARARNLIEENEGRIEVGDVSGVGAEFRVAIPKIA